VPFEPRFAAGVAAVILPIQQAEFEIPITLEAQPDLHDIAAFYQRGNGNFWVALVGDEVAGTLGLLDIGNRQAALRKMFVKAEYRGAAHGVAHALLQTLLDWCRAHDVAHPTSARPRSSWPRTASTRRPAFTRSGARSCRTVSRS
jgi:GNAT superfamily N-acetyltransferase